MSNQYTTGDETIGSSTAKSSRLLVRDYPNRALAIVSSSHALVLRYNTSTKEAIANGSLAAVAGARSRVGNDTPTSKCMVDFVPAADRLLHDFRTLSPQPIFGTLGLISINQHIFLCVVSRAARVATLRPGETVERILSVEFYCLNSADFDHVLSANPYELESSDPISFAQNIRRRDGETEYPYLELQKLLSNGSFYYSTDFDVTNRLQDRPVDSDTFNIDYFDDSFLWNSFMISPLLQFRSRLLPHEREALDASRILTSAIRGFCSTVNIEQSAAPLKVSNRGLPSLLTVISRLSCKRAGTRFNSRGIDDDGNVANFVETETVYWSSTGVLFSYAQVRGSVPVFWEQATGFLPQQQKITVTRSAEGTQPAFNKHFEDLEQAYGAVHVVNLLSNSKQGEVELSNQYRYGVKYCGLSRSGEQASRDHSLLQYTDYDFHEEVKDVGYEAANSVKNLIVEAAEGFAYYLAEQMLDDAVDGAQDAGRDRLVVVLQQEGVFRTNCLDCLDRTNLVQSIISKMSLEAFLQQRSAYATADFWARHATLWADNGDNLARIYAGTGALKSSFTRHGKMSLGGAISDVRKSATRMYINNFTDKARQNTIDMLLGRLVGQPQVFLFDPISDHVSIELSKRSVEYSSTEKITIWVGTFNLNGKKQGLDEDLNPWLLPAFLDSTQPEIVAVGFQEIVELSAQQIMNSDPTIKQAWERAIKRQLNAHAKEIGGDKYVLLRSGQLVGAALCIFVKSSVLSKIKNVEGSVKKTGMSGIAGNKGAVAIRMEYASTQLCFVTAHLAAGFANYEERNRDFATIHNGLRFQRNRSIDDHDTVIWLGDFNYRIGLNHATATELLRRQDLARLYDNDQLNLQMVAGLAFPYYSEARITFPPTYKFDIGTDRYDSSEKARIPAWTDRILRKGTNVKQLAYDSAPLRFSDHRPVYAVFSCIVNIIDETKKAKISQALYEKRKVDLGPSGIDLLLDDSENEDLIGYDPAEPGLPPASSDRQKWWLKDGQSARSTISPPMPTGVNATVVLNPNRPANPFTPTEEQDWVTVPRARSRLGSVSSSISSSPYEHVSHSAVLPGAAPATIPRKPPPKHDNIPFASSMGRMNISDDQINTQPHRGQPPPPPPPRRQTGMGAAPGSWEHVTSLSQQQATQAPAQRNRQVSSISFGSNKSKAPPPIARKPNHLVSSSPPRSLLDMDIPNELDQPRSVPSRASSNTQMLSSQLEGGKTPILTGGMRQPPPKSALTQGISTDRSHGMPSGAIALPGLTGRKPVAPPRPAHLQDLQTHPSSISATPRSKQRMTTDLLGDDGAGDFNGWETVSLPSATDMHTGRSLQQSSTPNNSLQQIIG